jgi:hypothetical protein
MRALEKNITKGVVQKLDNLLEKPVFIYQLVNPSWQSSIKKPNLEGLSS